MDKPDYNFLDERLLNPEKSPFKPEWDQLEGVLSAGLHQLCCYAHGVDYDALSNWESQSRDYERLGLYGESENLKRWAFCAIGVYLRHCVKDITKANSHTAESGGILKVIRIIKYSDVFTPLVSLDNFVEWADSQNIPLPNGFPRGDMPKPVKQVGEVSLRPVVEFPTIEEPRRKTEQWLFVKMIIECYRLDTGKLGSNAEILAWLKQGRELGGYGAVSLDGDVIKSKVQCVTTRTLFKVLNRNIRENSGT